jgi:O-antigen/teichoic acid export membrane protein
MTRRRGSIASDSLVRMIAEAGTVTFALVSGVITARSLGPSLKGALASLAFLVALLSPVAALGLGDVTAIRIGKRYAEARQEIGAAIGLLLLSTAAGAFAAAGLAWAILGTADGVSRTAIVLAAASLPCTVLATSLSLIVESRRRMAGASVAQLLGSAVTTAATYVLVVSLGRGVGGGILALLLGSATTTAILLAVLVGDVGLVRPTFHARFARSAVRAGAPILLAYVLHGAFARFDLLIVEAIRGTTLAGEYGVALTFGQVVIYAPYALSVAAFPRLTTSPSGDVRRLTALLVRTSVIASAALAVPLLASAHWVIPLVFGSGYRPAVVPAVILTVGALAWSTQWVLTRSSTALGRTRVLVQSYSVSVTVMIVGDLVVVRRYGTAGAAVCSLVAATAGMVVALRDHVTDEPGGRLRDYIPRASDVRSFLGTIRRVTRSAPPDRARSRRANRSREDPIEPERSTNPPSTTTGECGHR